MERRRQTQGLKVDHQLSGILGERQTKTYNNIGERIQGFDTLIISCECEEYFRNGSRWGFLDELRSA